MSGAHFVRVVDGIVADVVDGDPAELFHPDLAREFIKAPASVVLRSRRVDDKWLPPEPIVEPRKPETPRG